MAGIRHTLYGFLRQKSNCYSVLMVLTTLVFVASMLAGTAALQVELIATAPPQGNRAVAEITVGPLAKDTQAITQITQLLVRGNVTNISSRGEGVQLLPNIGEGDSNALVIALTAAGIAKPDAAELAKILGSERVESISEPMGAKAKAWLVQNLSKAADGTCRLGMAVATWVLTEAAISFYGFK